MSESDDIPPTPDTVSAVVTGPLVVEWYRIDVTSRVARVLVPSMALMTLGAGIAVLASTGRVDLATVLNTWHWRVPMTIAGLVIIAGAGFRAIFGLQRLLAEDACLVVRTDALVFLDGGPRFELPWEDLEESSWDASERALVLRLRDGSETRLTQRFAGIEGPALAKRLTRVRQRALFGLAN
jgi:hypothetical protein